MCSGGVSVGVLDAPVPAADDAVGWEVRLAALEGLSRAVAAEKARAQAALAGAVIRLRPDEAEFAPASVAVAQGVSPRSASTALGWAVPLTGMLPTTFGLLRGGEITVGLAREVARRCRNLTPEQAAAVEDRLWAAGSDRGYTQVVRRVREAVARLGDRDPAQAGPGEGRAARNVWLTPGATGTDTVQLHSILATIDAHATIAALDARYDPADSRTRAEQRADVLVETLTGETPFARWADAVDADADVDDLEVPGVARHWTVQVTVPLDVVIAGRGAAGIGADSFVSGLTGRLLARLALRAGGRVARLVTDPLSGQLRDLTLLGRAGPGAHRAGPPGTAPPNPESAAPPGIAEVIEDHYEPSEALARYVRARDRTCQHPDCPMPAPACDLDHIEAYDHDQPHLGGQTTAWNLVAVCRYHHRLKHEAKGWTLTRRPDSTLRWTSPTGHTTDTGPPHHGQVA